MNRQQENSSSVSSDGNSSNDGTQVVPDSPTEPPVSTNVIVNRVLTFPQNPNTTESSVSRLLRNTLESIEQPRHSRNIGELTVTPMTTLQMTSIQPPPVPPESKIIKCEVPIPSDQMTTTEAAILLASLGQVSPPLPSPFVSVIKKKKKNQRPTITDVKLPISTIEELDKIDIEIEHNELLKAKLLKRLGTIGGKNFGQCVRNALKALMTDGVAVQLNWAGRGGKKPFQNYELKSILFDAVRMSFPTVTDFQLKDPVQCWLKRSRNYQPRDIKAKRKSANGNDTNWLDAIVGQTPKMEESSN